MRLSLTDAAGSSLTGLYFHDADGMEAYLTTEFGKNTVQELYRGKTEILLTLAFSPSMDEYQGRQYPQVIISHYKKCNSV